MNWFQTMTLYNHVEFFMLILLMCVNKGDKGDKE